MLIAIIRALIVLIAIEMYAVGIVAKDTRWFVATGIWSAMALIVVSLKQLKKRASA